MEENCTDNGKGLQKGYCMRICLVGDFSENLDEGMRKVTFYLYKELSRKHDVLPLNSRKISLGFLKKISDFNPGIIHYTHGPSIISLMALGILALFSKAKTVTSATHSEFPFPLKRFIPLFKPDIILTQSYNTDKMFRNFGCKTEFFPNGVDMAKFISVSEKRRAELREKYGIDKEKFIILHVGSIVKRRNIKNFSKIQKKEGNQVIIVGSTSIPMEEGLYKFLKENGCIVWRSYLKDIEEIYQLSDCYIFPAKNVISSIELPLSVLEAMSCNLPVITTKFGALPRIFKEGDGLSFVDEEDDLVTTLESVKKSNIDIKTREKVIPYSWENIGEKLEEIYHKLIGEENEN